MNDLIRWIAKDVDDCVAGVASCEEWAAHYEAEAERVAFDPVVQTQMLSFAAMKRQYADEGRQRLLELRRRLEYVGG